MLADRYITITVAYEPGASKRPALEWTAPELEDAGLALIEEHSDPLPSRTWGGVVDGPTFERFADAWLPDELTDNRSPGTQSYTFDGLNWEVGGESPIVYVTIHVLCPTPRERLTSV